ncbi:MAG: Cyclic pyranopterin monophosphate synthase 1 [Syntrophorhabdus sp. PtaU1.Bin153]|nr:MAG: Cyclic pyranopterin monophosphate synthase 1 [Syntrophorhabdus sp. PtaU1.Bin153]
MGNKQGRAKNPLRSYQEGRTLRALSQYASSDLGLFKSISHLAKIGITSFLPYFGLSPVTGPLYVGWDLSYRCNCRCSFCDRWKQSPFNELSTEEIIKVSGQLKNAGAHHICIAGGEPLMNKDLPRIINALHGNDLRTGMCTNGLLLVERADEIMAAGLDHIIVSLDGKRESHDRIRGVKGLYDRAEAGIEHVLEKRGLRAKPTISVRMLVHEGNIDEIPAWVRKWDKTVDSCLVQPLHHGLHNLYKADGEIQTVRSTEKLRSVLAETGLSNSFHTRITPDYLADPSRFRHLPCYAGYLVARIDPTGNLYGCVEQIERIGNLREHTFGELWKSAEFNCARKRLSKNRQCVCHYSDSMFNTNLWMLYDKTPLINRMIRSRFGESITKCHIMPETRAASL